MSSNWNVPLVGLAESGGGVNASSLGTAVGTSWTQLIAATAYEWAGFSLSFGQRVGGSDTDISLGLGPAGNEYALIDRAVVTNVGSTYSNWSSVYFPLRVPAGSRVSVKLGTASTTVYAHVLGASPGSPTLCPSGAFLERVGTAGTGVVIDPGAAANTKGSWTSLGTTAYDWKGAYVNFGTDGSGTSADSLVDFGIDVAGVKQVLFADVPCQKGSGASVRPSLVGPLFCAVPAGTALYARSQCTSNSTTSRKIAAQLHGIV